MAQFGTWEPAVNIMDMVGMPSSDLVQGLEKPPIAQVGHFAAPQGYHATQFQVFEVNRVIPVAKIMRQLPVPILPLMHNVGMEVGKTVLCLAAMCRARFCPGQGSIGLSECSQGLLQRLWGSNIMAIMSREELRKPKVKTCGLTRLDSDDGLVLTQTREADDHASGWQAFDGYSFDDAFEIPGVVEAIETSEQPEAVGTVIAPTCLAQGDRVIPYTLAEGRWTSVLFAKELLIALVDAPDNILYSLSIQVFPMGKSSPTFELRHLALHAIATNIDMKAAIVPFLDGNHVVVHLRCQIDLAMQMPEPLALIELEDKGASCHLWLFLHGVLLLPLSKLLLHKPRNFLAGRCAALQTGYSKTAPEHGRKVERDFLHLTPHFCTELRNAV